MLFICCPSQEKKEINKIQIGSSSFDRSSDSGEGQRKKRELSIGDELIQSSGGKGVKRLYTKGEGGRDPRKEY